jgi:hypothetical protein
MGKSKGKKVSRRERPGRACPCARSAPVFPPFPRPSSRTQAHRRGRAWRAAGLRLR